MPEIRPLERVDLPTVAKLMRARLPGRTTADERFLEATLFDGPWIDPELPSLVAENAGEIVGFIGAQVRRLRIDGRSARGVCCSHLVVADGRRAGAAGALLVGRLLAGEQEATWSDSATDGVARIWQTFGGRVDAPRHCDWMVVLRPFAWGRMALAAAPRRSLGRDVLPVASVPLQVIGRRFLSRAFPALEERTAGEAADAAAIAAELPRLGRRLRLVVDYDERALSLLFGQVEAFRGELVTRIVRRNGHAVGWYAYTPRPKGVSRVLHLAAAEREADAVLGELVAHARAAGSAVLAGRLEPHLAAPLRRRLGAIGFARQPIVHAHDPSIDAILAGGRSLLTRLDSEWFVT